MDITQIFYDKLAVQYDKLFLDWQAAAAEQAVILDRIFRSEELTQVLQACGCSRGEWKFPEETGVYQPIVVAKK